MTGSGSATEQATAAPAPQLTGGPGGRWSWTLVVGSLLLLAIVIFALAAPLFGDPRLQDFNQGLDAAGLPQPVLTAGYPLGSDTLGRDLLPRLAYGGRISLLVALVSTVTSVALGLFVGVLAGFYRGATEGLLLRFADIALALPFTLAALVIATMTRPGAMRVILIITLLFWAYPARLFYGEVLSLRSRTFVAAAEASGVPGHGNIRRHILPHLWPLVLTYAPLNAAAAVGFEATLSYLGAGVNPPTPSWGNMIAEGESSIFFAPHLLAEPALMILLTTMSFLLIGEGLKARDPGRKRRSWLGV